MGETHGIRVSEALRDPFLRLAVELALALRLAILLLVRDTAPVNDEVDYLRLAIGLVAGEGFDSNFRPPLLPGFLALFIGGVGDVFYARFAMALIGSAVVVPVYLLARRVIEGERPARAAALLVAYDPVLIGFGHLLYSEVLFIALLLTGFWLLVRRPVGEGWGDWAGAGVAFGLGILARPQLATFMPLLLPWTLLQVRRGADRRRALRAFGALSLAACAVVLPWTVRNLAVWDSAFLVDTNGPYNLLVSTEPTAYAVDKDDYWDPRWGGLGRAHYLVIAERDPGAAQRLALRHAGRAIAERPLAFAKKCAWEVRHFFTLDNFVLRHIRNGWYGSRPTAPLNAVATLSSAAFTVLLWGAGLVGLIALAAGPLRGLVLLAVVHAVVLFGLTYSLSRYAVPLRPLLAIGAGWVLYHPVQVLRGLAANRWRRVVSIIAVAWLLGAWLQDVPLLWDMLATGGDGHLFVREDLR